MNTDFQPPSAAEMEEYRKRNTAPAKGGRAEPPWEQDVPVTCFIEGVESMLNGQDETGFKVNFRLLSGKNRGQSYTQFFYKYAKGGKPRSDTWSLVAALLPEVSSIDFWSWMLKHKVVKLTAWKNKEGYWNLSKFIPAEPPPEMAADLKEIIDADKKDDDDIPF